MNLLCVTPLSSLRLILCLIILHQVLYSTTNSETVEFIGSVSSPSYANILVDNDTNKVYIGGKNFLYKLDSDLNIEISASTRPLSSDNSYEGLENNYNKLLLEYSDETLLVCGTAEYGACELADKTNMQPLTDSYGPSVSFAVNGTTAGIVVSITDVTDPVVYIASTYPGALIPDLTDDVSYPPDIACLNPGSEFSLCVNTIIGSSKIQLQDDVRSSYAVEYADMFQAGDYVYMFTVQTETLETGSPIQSRIVRIHKDNTLFMKKTHMEIPIGLNFIDSETGDDISMQYISGGCYSEVAGSLMTSFRLESSEAVFLISHDQDSLSSASVVSSPTRSGLWVTDTASIDRKFTETLASCLEGGTNESYILTYMSSYGTDQCQDTDADANDYLETGHSFYYPVASYEDLSVFLLYDEPVDERGYFTAVNHVLVGGKSLVYIGTSNGYLLKLHITRIYRTVYSTAVIDEQKSKVLKLMFTATYDKLYILTENKVVRRDVYFCGDDLDCTGCFEHFIQYCGWCNDTSSCTLQLECEDVWTPYYSTENNCGDYQPCVVSIWPPIGPMSGGTLLNLEMSSDPGGIQVTVYMESTMCRDVTTIGTIITCYTPGTDVMGEHLLTVYVGSLEVENDKSFNYTLDPTISGVSRLTSFLSGGLDMHVQGERLNSIQTPLIQMTVGFSSSDSASPVRRDTDTYINNETTVYSACGDVEWGSMVCQTPNLGYLTTDADSITNTAYSFILDDVETYLNDISGVFGGFTIFPDPIYEPLGLVEVSGSGYITIQGRNMSLVCNESDVVITIGEDMKCDITIFSDSFVTCWMDIDDMKDGDTATIIVYTGNIVANVGTVIISTSHVVLIVLLTLVLLTILFIGMGVLVWRRGWCLTLRNPLKNKLYLHPVAMSTLSRSVELTTHHWIDTPENSTSVPGGPVDNIYNNDLLSMISDETREKLIDVLIRFERIEIHDMIGKGHFGRVDEGILVQANGHRKTVAVKSLIKAYSTMDELESFIQEGLIMKEFNHPNVMQLLGISVDRMNRPYVLLPLMTNGDLLTYIRQSEITLTVRQLLQFAQQIAWGMEYLSCHRFVHRDLAARNCMIDDMLGVRVSDFGMTKDVYCDNVYVSTHAGKVPIKWMALESIEERTYDQTTDVWSFGVLMWELFTRGTEPYPGMFSWEVLAFLKRGYRLDAPEFSPDFVNKIMFSCWKKSGKCRPTFPDLVKQLDEIIDDATTESDSIYLRAVNLPSLYVNQA